MVFTKGAILLFINAHSSNKISTIQLVAQLGVESEVINLLKKNPLSKKEIAIALGKDKPTRYLNELMKRLIEEQKVEYTIPDKPNSRLQKYRLK